MRWLLSLIFLPAGLAWAQPCVPSVEEAPSRDTAVLRPHANAFQQCAVDEATYGRLVSHWLGSRPPGAPLLGSLALGRAVNYPWLSQYLTEAATRDSRWRALAARTPRDRRDRLLARLLDDPALRERLSAPLAGSPYELAGVSYEKVLWNEAGLPFDAQLWLRLKPRR